jgi:hypothetical protein
LAHFLRDCLFADFVSDLVGYLLRKNFFWIHLNQDQINLREDNRYENRIIIRNSFSVFSSHFCFLKNSSFMSHYVCGRAGKLRAQSNLLQAQHFINIV